MSKKSIITPFQVIMTSGGFGNINDNRSLNCNISIQQKCLLSPFCTGISALHSASKATCRYLTKEKRFCCQSNHVWSTETSRLGDLGVIAISKYATCNYDSAGGFVVPLTCKYNVSDKHLKASRKPVKTKISNALYGLKVALWSFHLSSFPLLLSLILSVIPLLFLLSPSLSLLGRPPMSIQSILLPLAFV